MQFLAESKVVYETFEDVLKDEKHPECKRAGYKSTVSHILKFGIQHYGLTLHRRLTERTQLVCFSLVYAFASCSRLGY